MTTVAIIAAAVIFGGTLSGHITTPLPLFAAPLLLAAWAGYKAGRRRHAIAHTAMVYRSHQRLIGGNQ